MSNKKIQLSITISPADGSDIVIDPSGLPTSGKVGVPFAGSLAVSGGQPPYEFSLTSGALPDGVSLNSDGSFSGTPTASGAFAFEVNVKDSAV